MEEKYAKDTIVYETLKVFGNILFETVIGSQAHGTSTPKSDVDTTFVYMAPQAWLYARADYKPHLRLSKDRVGYELEHFLGLASTSNPSVNELLFSPEDCWISKNPIYDLLHSQRHKLLSKTAKDAYLGYAASQIRKAQGMEKFQNWDKSRTERKTPMDFCWVISNEKGYDTIPLRDFMELHGIQEHELGVTNVNHAPNVFSLFRGDNFRGIFGDNSDQILFSSIPKEMNSIALMSYNQDAFKMHNADWKRYTTWKKEVNRDRWVETKDGKSIDAKNVMHLVRLMEMNREIATGKGCLVRRPNREELLAIRNGERNLDEIIAWAEVEEEEVKKLYEQSDLPKTVDMQLVRQILLRMRSDFYMQLPSTHINNIITYPNAFLQRTASPS